MQSLPEATMAVDMFLIINCLTIYSVQLVQCFSPVIWCNGKWCKTGSFNETTRTSFDWSNSTAVASLNQTLPLIYWNYSTAMETFSVSVVSSFEMPNMMMIQEQSTRLMRKRRKLSESIEPRVIASSYINFTHSLLNSQCALDTQSHCNQSNKINLLTGQRSMHMLLSSINGHSQVSSPAPCDLNSSELISTMPGDRVKDDVLDVLFTEQLLIGFLSRLPVASEFANELYQHAQRMMDQNIWLISQFELERKLSDLVLHELITQYDRALNSNDVFLVGYDGEDTVLGHTMASLGLWPDDEALSFVLKANGTLEVYFAPENLSYFLFNCLIGFLGIRYN